MFGILNIYKPQGITSHDVVSIVRKILGIKQVGHTGTLDPFAQGVLPVCIGKATRLIDYFEDDKIQGEGKENPQQASQQQNPPNYPNNPHYPH